MFRKARGGIKGLTLQTPADPGSRDLHSLVLHHIKTKTIPNFFFFLELASGLHDVTRSCRIHPCPETHERCDTYVDAQSTTKHVQRFQGGPETRRTATHEGNTKSLLRLHDLTAVGHQRTMFQWVISARGRSLKTPNMTGKTFSVFPSKPGCARTDLLAARAA